ncbi:unnamed protein product [Caenorhabditis sp. 36 PRJEB53466]|nr:unnamed protein product [Caenorhabditis sp. 36 PRJEB53466]
MAQSTHFNPFGEYESDVKTLKMELEKVCEDFERDLRETTVKGGATAESKEIGTVLDKLTDVVKKIVESAVQSLVSEVVDSLAMFVVIFTENSDKLKNSDMMSMSRSISKFVQIVADRIAEPFTSALLERWTPLFEALLGAKMILLRDVGVVLWKATFQKVKGSLRYSGQLRKILERIPKKSGITLPAEEKTPTVFTDDEEEAMDGMGPPAAVNAPKPSEESQSFQFSQQPLADEVAERLLKEKKQKELEKVQKDPSAPTTPSSRRRQSKMASLLDEDSCDFVPITATPPSSKRKNRLTDRQKEKLAEAGAPRTDINYVDEESQSGVQKTEQMKAALKAMNFDVAEESMSSAPVIRKQLFDTTTTTDGEIFANSDEKTEENSKMTETTEEKTPSKRKGGRTKKTPKQCPPESSPVPKKRLRSSMLQKTDSTDSEGSTKSPEAKKADASVEKALESPEPREMTPESKELVDVEMKDSDDNLEVSPPKTPRTPSILRLSKRGIETPASEKKLLQKNRVHFGEESLPKDGLSNPSTPRRSSQIVLAIVTKSPQKPLQKTSAPSAAASSSSSLPSASECAPIGLLEIEDPTSSNSPIYRPLMECVDPIERIVRNLSSLLSKPAVDATKRALQQAGIQTVGDFAAISRKQLNELAGIKHPKEKCARSVLAEYDARKRAEQRVSEERQKPLTVSVEETESMDTTEKTDDSPLPAMPMIMSISPPKVTTMLSPAPIVPTSTPADSENCKKTAMLVQKAVNADEVRKNLAPIFDKTKTIRMESPLNIQKMPLTPLTPQKPTSTTPAPSKAEKVPTTGVNSMIEDSRLLHRICSSLSRAHSVNQLPTEKWTSLLDTVNKAAILFKNIVQERGSLLSEWDDVDFENGPACGSVLAPEEDVKTLRAVYRRMSRHHALGDVDDVDWKAIMETVNEAAVLLRSIVAERAPRA